jgi:hypothetical protein
LRLQEPDKNKEEIKLSNQNLEKSRNVGNSNKFVNMNPDSELTSMLY